MRTSEHDRGPSTDDERARPGVAWSATVRARCRRAPSGRRAHGRSARPLRLRPRSTGPPGSTLVETLVATAVLGVVLVALSTPLVIGARTIHAARVHGQAVRLASGIAGELRSLHVEQVAEVLGAGRGSERRALRWSSERRGPDRADPRSGFDELLDRWRAEAAATLPDGQVVLSVRGLDGLGAPAALAPIGRARVLQVLVTVRWRQGSRPRAVTLTMLRS